MRRLLVFGICLLALACASAGGEPMISRYDRVEIAPTQTSIYLGSVSMTIPSFERKSGVYESEYTAKVFPFFFYNEQGRLYIDVSDETLLRLARGETIEFTGRGVRDDGLVRHVVGRAICTDSISGKIKVRVFVTRTIQLIFNTTYRFVAADKKR